MYQYKAARARSKGLDATWSDIDLSAVEINSLYLTYSKVILTLTNPAVPNDLYLDMDVVRASIAPSLKPRTVVQWLASIGESALPTSNNKPVHKERLVKFADIWEADYSVEPVDRKRAYNAQLPKGDKNDLLISREDVDFNNLWKYCMVSVNGMFHRVGGSPEGLYVVEGGRTGATYNDNHVGLLSFREVGALEYIPIVAGMVYKSHVSQKYANYADVKLPAPVEGKTILLVLGGYLHVLDSTYRQTGLQSVRIDFNNYPLPERIFESFGRIHMESLGLETSANNPLHFAREELYSDETLLAYMTLPQSFFVVVDTPHLFSRRHYVEKTKLPGCYVTATPFDRLPLFSGLGRNYAYKPSHEWGRMVLSCENAIDQDFNFNQTHWQTNLSLDDKSYSSAPWDFARAYLLEIGRYSD